VYSKVVSTCPGESLKMGPFTLMADKKYLQIKILEIKKENNNNVKLTNE